MLSKTYVSFGLQLGQDHPICGKVSDREPVGIIWIGPFGSTGTIFADPYTLDMLADVCRGLARRVRDEWAAKAPVKPAAEESVDLHRPPRLEYPDCEHGKPAGLCPECGDLP